MSALPELEKILTSLWKLRERPSPLPSAEPTPEPSNEAGQSSQRWGELAHVWETLRVSLQITPPAGGFLKKNFLSPLSISPNSWK
uniref:Uncharacterized protein n=1 Tax=Mustela putorius furo TaxID=9669 RepID=M3XZA2_MUSPF